MFDSIYLEIDCPFCNKRHEVEAQTKDLDCEMYVWKPGNHIGDQHKDVTQLYCTASCDDKYISISEMNPKPKSLDEFAERRGTKEYFNLILEIKDSIISEKYKIIKKE